MEETTYLEDYLQSVELLPNDIRRDFELMREHDKDCYEGLQNLKQLEPKFLNDLKKRKIENKPFDDMTKSYDEINSIYKRIKHRVSQKTNLASNMLKDLEKFIRKLDSDLTFFESELRGFGEFEQCIKGYEPGSEVYVHVTVALRVSNVPGSEIILGRVIFYHNDIGMYDIADIDDSKRYHVSDKQIVLLNLQYSITKLSKGEEILAVYPDTTSFYPAVVTQAAKRNMINIHEPTVMVQFHGDDDETGQTPSRPVPLQHIIRPPEDWIVK